MPRVDDVPGLGALAGAHVEHERARVGETDRVRGTAALLPPQALTESRSRDPQNGEYRRSCDQERMMDDVFEEAIDCNLYAEAGPKAAKYSA